MLINRYYQEICDNILMFPVIDTHEHLLWNEEDRVKEDTDVLKEYLSHYLKSDLISAGLKPEDLIKVNDLKTDITDRWEIVEPYWEASRYTGYGRALDIAVKGIYDIDTINRQTIRDLNDAFLEINDITCNNGHNVI